jgi:DNA repair photolyase
VLTENDSPDVPFRWSVNPYRGCAHACSYCYARPTHQVLGLGAGTDFDTQITVKVNAPELLAARLRRGPLGEAITFSGVTDCYQPLEARYRITRRCLEVCLAAGQAVAVITKSALVRRDVDVLARMARGPGARVFLSIPFADEELGRKVEPGASSPARRLETLRVLAEAGIETGVSVSPVIPGLSEAQVPRVLELAAAAGARRAFMILLRLPAEVRPVFEERLRDAFPERAEHVLSAIRDVRGGRLSDPRFGARMRGSGPRWEALRRLFEIACRRHGLEWRGGAGPESPTARRSGAVQRELY